MMANAWTRSKQRTCWRYGSLPFCAGQFAVQTLVLSDCLCFSYCVPEQSFAALSHKISFLVSKKQLGHHLLTWTEKTDTTSFYCSPKSLVLFSRFWRASDGHGLAGLPLYSCHFAASQTERLEDDTCWAPAASACGVCLGRIVAPIEASG